MVGSAVDVVRCSLVSSDSPPVAHWSLMLISEVLCVSVLPLKFGVLDKRQHSVRIVMRIGSFVYSPFGTGSYRLHPRCVLGGEM